MPGDLHARTTHVGRYVGIDDCWAVGRNKTTGVIVPNPNAFPEGMKALADYAGAPTADSPPLPLSPLPFFHTTFTTPATSIADRFGARRRQACGELERTWPPRADVDTRPSAFPANGAVGGGRWAAVGGATAGSL